MPGASHHLGRRSLTAIISTDTDWGTSRFIIDGLTIDDRSHPEGYAAPHLFSDPDGGAPDTAARPFPYQMTEHVTIRGLTVTSGMRIRTSPDARLTAHVQVVEAD